MTNASIFDHNYDVIGYHIIGIDIVYYTNLYITLSIIQYHSVY